MTIRTQTRTAIVMFGLASVYSCFTQDALAAGISGIALIVFSVMYQSLEDKP